MLFSIVEGSGSMARCSMLVQAHSGEITPTIVEAPARLKGLQPPFVPLPLEPYFTAPDEDREHTSQIQDAQLLGIDTTDSVAK